MYYNLVHALKRRVILELQDSFSQHPVYRKVAPYIQNRFSFEERPQYGIVVKGSSANKVALSGDNYIGVVQSHVMLAYVGQAVHPLEWIREDLVAVKKNGGRMPSPPGVYYIEILTAPTLPGEMGTFAMDPLYTVVDEPVAIFMSGVERYARLNQVPVQKTVRLWENRNYLLNEDVDYSVDYETGDITFLKTFGRGATISADYRFAGTSVGPIPFAWNSADLTTIPGVVLAFGKRSEAGQKIAVVIYEDRVDAAKAYGGKFEVSFDLDIIARDSVQVEEMVDLAMMYLWAQKKEALEFEGIEIMDVSMGGEAEEVADETGENFFYQASMSLQMRADWEMHVPLPLTLTKVTPVTRQGETDPRVGSGIQAVANEIFFSSQAIFAGRNDDYERIG